MPTSGELTSTIVTMALYNNQAIAPSVTKLVLPIIGGSSSEPANKKQKKEAQRRVQHVRVQGPFIRSKWSHIPITFSQEDLQLKDYPHNDAMVISYAVKGQHNTRTEQVVFDIVDMEYPYNAIIGRGTLINAFEAILHP